MESKRLALDLKEREIYSRERGLDVMKKREEAVSKAGRTLAARDILLQERETKCDELVCYWKARCLEKEEQRSKLESRYTDRMLKDGCVLLSSGVTLARAVGETVSVHTLVVENALEQNIAESKAEREKFAVEKIQWILERDAWTVKTVDAGARATELQMYATCLERGISIVHRAKLREDRSYEGEKKKLARALERAVLVQDDMDRKDKQLAAFRLARRTKMQRIRRDKLKDCEQSIDRSLSF